MIVKNRFGCLTPRAGFDFDRIRWVELVIYRTDERPGTFNCREIMHQERHIFDLSGSRHAGNRRFLQEGANRCRDSGRRGYLRGRKKSRPLFHFAKCFRYVNASVTGAHANETFGGSARKCCWQNAANNKGGNCESCNHALIRTHGPREKVIAFLVPAVHPKQFTRVTR